MMRDSSEPNTFYREQALANLRFLFGPRVDILTCLVPHNNKTVPYQGPVAVALAYITQGDGSRVNIMQAPSDYEDVKGALQALHDLSAQRLAAGFAECGYEVPIETIDSCEIVLPSEPGTETNAADGQLKSNDHAETETPVNELTPKTATLLRAKQRKYPVLMSIQCNYDIDSAFKYIESASPECLLQAARDITTAAGREYARSIVLKSVYIRKGDTSHAVLDDDVGGLLNAVFESEKFPSVHCSLERPNPYSGPDFKCALYIDLS
ncbi:hypothetical protein AN5087.2 [Paecilomyces variotii No. 5]|uniref:Uncharacterized protein n=1 Tax=Byssochlamys spectabilis (strain No. 5 / NBRC 109023) TaxID=1356009 RepID=V5HVS1_BYSSN|nr:hypothetical protein AN5087.2 [Paecilomyces variotii No. 5]